MSLLSVGLSLLSVLGYAAGVAIERRAVIAHDAVVGFPETVPDTTVGQLYLKYKPHLKVVNGCVPFPAVDADGNTRCALPSSHVRDFVCKGLIAVCAAAGSHHQADRTPAARAAPGRCTLVQRASTTRSRSCMPGTCPRSAPHVMG